MNYPLLTRSKDRYSYGDAKGSPNLIIHAGAPVMFSKLDMTNEGLDTVTISAAQRLEAIERRGIERFLDVCVNILQSNQMTSNTLNKAQIYNYLNDAQISASYIASIRNMYALLQSMISEGIDDAYHLARELAMDTEERFRINYSLYLTQLEESSLLPKSAVAWINMFHTPFLSDQNDSSYEMITSIRQMYSSNKVTDVVTALQTHITLMTDDVHVRWHNSIKSFLPWISPQVAPTTAISSFEHHVAIENKPYASNYNGAAFSALSANERDVTTAYKQNSGAGAALNYRPYGVACFNDNATHADQERILTSKKPNVYSHELIFTPMLVADGSLNADIDLDQFCRNIGLFNIDETVVFSSDNATAGSPDDIWLNQSGLLVDLAEVVYQVNSTLPFRMTGPVAAPLSPESLVGHDNYIHTINADTLIDKLVDPFYDDLVNDTDADHLLSITRQNAVRTKRMGV